LQANIHLRYFIKQQGATVRFLEFTDAARECASECALLMAEEFRLHEIARNRRAVDGNERLTSACTFFVDVAGDHLFTCAGFPRDEHTRITWRDLFGHGKGAAHRLRSMDDGVRFLGNHLKHGSNKLFIGRQGDIFFCAGTNGIGGGFRVDLDAASDKRDGDTLIGEHFGETGDILMHLDHDDVGTLAVAQHLVSAVNVGYL
jgi:hypothetical protein